MPNPKCTEPGCGLGMEPDEVFHLRWVCPRNADAHELCRKLAESEAKVAALEAKLGEAHGSCQWKLDDWDGSWDASCGLKLIFDESDNLADHEMHFCPKCGRKIDQEARKKGAEHGE